MDSLSDPRFVDALQGSIEGGWEGYVWRQVVGMTDPLRTNVLGARWNPRGMEVLYCSLSRRGAELELRAVLDRQPVPVRGPRRTHRLSVGLSKVGIVDAPVFLNASGITRGDLVGTDWSIAQQVGRAADWLGITGLIVPSARHDDGNLVILVNRLVAGDFYELSQDGGMLNT